MIVRELDLIRVKGRTKPVIVYELLGPIESFDQYHDLIARFERGLRAYRTGRWEEALAVFEETASEHPNDYATHLYTERCHELLAQPPEGVWDGVYVMKTK